MKITGFTSVLKSTNHFSFFGQFQFTVLELIPLSRPVVIRIPSTRVLKLVMSHIFVKQLDCPWVSEDGFYRTKC